MNNESALIAALRKINGDAHVLCEQQECAYYSQDIYTEAQPVSAVARPENIEELAKTVRTVSDAGYAAIPRGGGMSYSSGYLPVEKNSVMVDMGRMNRILEINREDMYVRVECGVTWKELHEALKKHQLRTPYWGTLSGIHATVGGGLSQNSIFWGSGRYGSAADSVLSMDIVLADGSILRTGSAARQDAPPFHRHYGPDLSGLFSAECGALGFKAHAVLPLIPELPAQCYASFAFESAAQMLPAMSEMARCDVVMQCFGFDPTLQEQRMKRESLMKDAQQFLKAVKSSGSLYSAAIHGMKMMFSGRRFMKKTRYSCHIIIEERSRDAARQALKQVGEIARRFSGKTLPDSIPRLVRANPFTPLNNVLGSEGERWMPLHGLTPHSRALPGFQQIEEYFQSQAQRIQKHNIRIGYLFAVVGTGCFVLEPVFYWPDAMGEIHRRTVEPQVLDRLKKFPEDLEARKTVQELRQDVIDILGRLGAIHMQLGKAYPYRQALRPEAWKIVRAVKETVDPQLRINPGTLGFTRDTIREDDGTKTL